MFFDIFSALCEQKGVSKNAVATKIGLSNSTVTKWKKTSATPESATLAKIASFFDVPIDFLLGNTPEAHLLWSEYRLKEERKAFEREADPIRKNQIACDIDNLTESIQDQRMSIQIFSAESKKAAHSGGSNRIHISDDAHHVGVLYDRADEKDKLLTHTVLDKYEDANKVVSINTKQRNNGGLVEIDVFDEPAAAGVGNYLSAPESHREQFPAFMIPKGADFGIRISGHSMEPMVSDGSTVFVKQTMTVQSGRVGVFVLNGESFCKQLIVDREKQEVRLHSLNPDYADIIVTPADTLITIGQVL